MEIDPTPGTEAEAAETFECERFPVDRFDTINVREVAVGFHTLAWAQKATEKKET